MFKNILIGLNLLLLVVLAYSFFRNSKNDQEIVYINSPKLIAEYKGTKDAREKLEKNTKQWKSNVDTLSAEFEREMKKFEKERQRLTPKEKTLTEQLLRNKQQQFMQYQQVMQQKVTEEGKKIEGEVMSKIDAFLKAYGKSKNYKIVFGATGSGNIVYADEVCDITAEVIKKLNEEYNRSK